MIMDDLKAGTAKQMDTSWQDDPKLKKVSVVVRTPNCILNRYTYCLKQQRLLDALNTGFTTRKIRVGADFLPLFQIKKRRPFHLPT